MKKNMLSGLFALSVMSSALAGDLTDGLVSWFSFEGLDGNGRVENLADAARPLTLKDGTSLTDGSFNGSSALTSDGRLNACGTFDVPAMTNLTFSMWVRRDTDVGTYPDSSYPHLIANVPGGIRIVMDKTAKGATIYVGDPYLSANPALERKIWQHLLMTFEEVSRDDKCSTINYRFYVNGSLAKEELNWKVMRTSGTTTTYGFLGSTGNMNVKLSGNGGNRPFTGLIDEVRFWRRALSREEAAAEYARLSALPEETLVCHWTFDEIAGSGSSRTVADVGRYGATLRLGDGVTATDGVLNGAVKADGYTRSWALFNLPKKMSDMTFCGWVNQSVDSSLDNTTKIGGSNGGPRFFVSGSNYLIFEASPQATSSPSKWSGAVKDEAHVFNPSHPAQGVWFHFALTTHYDYDAANANYLATQCFYVNGEKTSELSSGITPVF